MEEIMEDLVKMGMLLYDTLKIAQPVMMFSIWCYVERIKNEKTENKR